MVCHADVVKNRYMTQPDVNPPRFPTVRSVAKYVYQTEGLIGFYRGKQAAVNKLIYNIWFPFCLTSFAKSKQCLHHPLLGFLPSFLRAFPTNASAVLAFETVMKLLQP
jgi:solute carrier family 25 carnitine/acylcarnitine transporter 20/29